jgi:putative hydrolase of HD superfamily
MAARETIEAKLYKALDGLEAVIQHNDSPLDTWLPLEYELNLTYAEDRVTFSPYLTALRAEIRRITEEKIANESKEEQ